MHSHLVLLLLAITVTLISAKNIHQIDEENNSNEEQAEITHANDDFIRSKVIQAILNLFQNERNRQEENDRLQAIAKRAKAIIKGDPREFMG